MHHGDISNRGAFAVAFRVEDCIIVPKRNGIFSKAIRNFNSLYGYEIDESMRSLVAYVFRRTPWSIDLLFDQGNIDNPLVREVIDTFHAGGAIPLKNPVVISTWLREKVYEYYVDNNPERLSCVGTDGAVTSEEFRRHIGF